MFDGSTYVHHEEWCLYCEGEGGIEVQEPGPYPRDAIEPRWGQRECPVCHGAGAVDVDRCLRCGLVTEEGDEGTRGQEEWDNCTCSDSVLSLWARGPRTPEVADAADKIASSVENNSRSQREAVLCLRRIAYHLSDTLNNPGPPQKALAEILFLEAAAQDYPVKGED